MKTVQLRAVRRDNLFAFLTWAFGVIAPGEDLRAEDYLLAMCFALEQVARKLRLRQLVAVPPRHLKSVAAVAMTAWMMGNDPTAKIIVVSYGGDLAAKHMRQLRMLLRHSEFRAMFPRFKLARDTADEIETTLGGYRRSATPAGATTGFGADLIIIDDMIKAGDASSETMREAANSFFDQTLYSRFNNKQEGAILAIQQRLHENDIVGHLRKKCDWDEFILPAMATDPQTFPTYFGKTFRRVPGDILSSIETREVLEEARRMMGEATFSAQYQQNPTPLGGNRIKAEWFGSYEEPPKRERLLHVVQSWDTALSAEPRCDWSVCLTFGTLDGRKWLLLDHWRRQVDYPDLRTEARVLFQRWLPDKVIIEKASTGGPLAMDLRKDVGELMRARISAWVPLEAKEVRVEISTVPLKEGLVALPAEAEWLSSFRQEVTGFPAARHDDQVDALTQFVEWLNSRRGRGHMRRDPETGRLRPGQRPQGSSFRRAA